MHRRSYVTNDTDQYRKSADQRLSMTVVSRSTSKTMATTNTLKVPLTDIPESTENAQLQLSQPLKPTNLF